MVSGTQVRVYSLAFLTYFGFYVSREPYSLVKMSLMDSWYPFDGPDGWLLLGLLDTASLTAYAIGIVVVGYLCEKFDSLYVLVLGCFAAGITTILYGMADFWNIHDYWYFLTLRVLNGFAEACGYPTLIKMLDHYFCMEVKRDFIMTAFGCCKFSGIVVGCLIASFTLSFNNWGACFIYCGLVVIAVGVMDIFFLPSLPPNTPPCEAESIPILRDSAVVMTTHLDGYYAKIETNEEKSRCNSAASSSLHSIEERHSGGEVFWLALRLPGIMEYAFHLFFVKLSVYILYYWLPTWLESLAIQGTVVNYKSACYYTALWGVGGCIGTLLIGWAVYTTKLYGSFSGVFSCTASAVILTLYWYSGISNLLLIFLLILLCVGITQNGPYSLASACMPSVINRLHSAQNGKLVGMATGIIDGVGSVGAIFGPLSGALILQYTSWGWGAVFLIVAVSMLLAALILVRQVYNEGKAVYRRF